MTDPREIHDGADPAPADIPPLLTRLPDGTMGEVTASIPHRARVRLLVPLAGVRGEDLIQLEPGTMGTACGLWPEPVPDNAEDKRRGFWHLIAVEDTDGHGPWHVPALPDQVAVSDAL